MRRVVSSVVPSGTIEEFFSLLTFPCRGKLFSEIRSLAIKLRFDSNLPLVRVTQASGFVSHRIYPHAAFLFFSIPFSLL